MFLGSNPCGAHGKDKRLVNVDQSRGGSIFIGVMKVHGFDELLINDLLPMLLICV